MRPFINKQSPFVSENMVLNCDNYFCRLVSPATGVGCMSRRVHRLRRIPSGHIVLGMIRAMCRPIRKRLRGPSAIKPHAVAVVSFNPEPAATVAPLATPSPLAPG